MYSFALTSTARAARSQPLVVVSVPRLPPKLATSLSRRGTCILKRAAG